MEEESAVIEEHNKTAAEDASIVINVSFLPIFLKQCLLRCITSNDISELHARAA